MKKTIYLRNICFCVLAGMFGSCNISPNQNVRFNPEDRTTVSMSEQEKEARLHEIKDTEKLGVLSLLEGKNVKMSVLPPASSELSDEQAEKMAIKMLQMLSQNGVGGLNNVPGFAFTAAITTNSKKATGSAPQKFIVDYDINYSVINTITGDVYSASTQKVQGVGNSFEQAINNALSEIVPGEETGQMLAVASQKIIDWYDDNLATFKRQVTSAEAEGNFALALALIQSVPQEATDAFSFAESRLSDVENKFMLQISHSELAALKQAVVQSDNEPCAEVYAHYSLISPTSKVYSEAQNIMKKYEQDVENKRIQDTSQRQANLEAERQQQMELAKMENSRIKAKYEAQASEQAIRLYLSQNSSGGGFWRNLGSRIIGAIDGTNWQYRVKNTPYTED